MTGSKDGARRLPRHRGGPPRLEVRALSSAEFSDVSFVAMPGEIIGFAGLLGSGTTELVSALFGSPPPVAGKSASMGGRSGSMGQLMRCAKGLATYLRIA